MDFIIRVNEQDFLDIDNELVLIDGWYKAEPIPSEHWRPACWTGTIGNGSDGLCAHPYFDHEDSCEKCPYRIQGGN